MRAGQVRQGIGALVAIGLLVAPSEVANSATGSVSALYSLALGPFRLGQATAQSVFDESGYAVTISGEVAGLARLFSDAHATLSSNGRLSGGKVLPQTFLLDSWEGDSYVGVRMELDRGAVTGVELVPPLEDDPDRVPLAPPHRRGVLDPVSAFIMPLPVGHAPDGPSACNRSLPVFDGWQRFDLQLYFKGTREVRSGQYGYTGPVFVCGARYQPVAGHNPYDDSVQQMLANDSLEIWLAALGGDVPYLVPYYVGLDTDFGTLSVRAVRLTSSDQVLVAR
jgi:hypothetical protein